MEGSQIRKLRKSLNLTQEQMAEKLKIKKLAVTRWELGERKCRGASKLLIEVLTKFNLWDQV